MISPKLVIATKVELKNSTFEDFLDDCWYNDTTQAKVICPFCENIEKIEDYIQYEDYTTHPMIWADCCEARSILLEGTFTQNVKYEKQFPESGYTYFYTIELAKIKRISTHQLYTYKITGKTPGEEQIRLTIELDVSRKYTSCIDTDEEIMRHMRHNSQLEEKREERKRLLKQLKLEERTHKDWNNDWDNAIGDSTELYRLSLPVDSYNVQKPGIPYPENIDLCHESTIYILCEDENGKEFSSPYWDD